MAAFLVVCAALPVSAYGTGHNGRYFEIGLSGDPSKNDDVDLGEIQPGATVYLNIYCDGQPATKADITNEKVTYQQLTVAADVLTPWATRSIQYDKNGNAVIPVTFKSSIPGDGLIDFAFQFYLLIDKNRGTADITEYFKLSGQIAGTYIPTTSTNTSHGQSVGGGGTPLLSVDHKSALASANAAIKTALANGKSEAKIVFNYVSDIPLKTMQAIAAAAKKAGVAMTIQVNNTVDGAISVLLSFDPSKATKDIKLTAYLQNARVTKVKAQFEKNFGQPVAVVNLSQKTDFGMPVRIMAKVDMSKLDTSKPLYFYAHNATDNKYQAIDQPNYTISGKGALYFDTALAGSIVISNRK
jgi:hypothetical protein